MTDKDQEVEQTSGVVSTPTGASQDTARPRGMGQFVPVADAAGLVGRNRKSLYRDISRGKLSATVSGDGSKQIAVSELLRVYGPLRESGAHETEHVTVAMPQKENAAEASVGAAFKTKIAALEAEVAQLRERLADKDQNLMDLRSAIRLLDHEKKEPKRGFLGRLFGR